MDGKVKYLPNSLTIARMVGAVSLLFMKPLSAIFFIIYFLCGLTDILDGLIARKTRTTSRLGETLDSIADLILVVVIMILFAPIMPWQIWMFIWLGAIVFIKLLTLAIGFLKYRAFTSLHTYANKVMGISLFCFPVLFITVGLPITAIILCTVSSLSALDEIIIIIRSKELDKNVAGLFFTRRYT